VKTGIGKNDREIEIQEGSNLTNPLVIGEYTLYRGSPFKLVPTKMGNGEVFVSFRGGIAFWSLTTK